MHYEFNLVNAYPCSDEGSIHSASGGTAVSFSFTNNSSDSLQIIWLNYAGARVVYDTLQPGLTFNVNTYTGHTWLIANPQSGCLGIYFVKGNGQVTVF